MGRCVKCGRDWPKGYRACPVDGAKLGVSMDAPHSGHTPPAVAAVVEGPADLIPGTVIGEYVVEGKLGEGGMGAVYGARHPVIGKKAAIKVISPQLCADPGAVERFIQEARAVNQIGHPNIVDVFSFGELPDRRSYFVMELLGGESLGDRMARERVPLADAIEILDQIADALDAAHETGIVHRDLKPDNVFVVPVRGGRQIVKLLDFGIAKLGGSGDVRVQRTRTGVMMGTPAYMSPEQARGKNVDHRTDVYALGALAYEMLLGVLPFDADNAMDIVMQHLTEPPPPPALIWPEIPPPLGALLLAMLAKDPAARPTLHQVRECLSDVRTLTGVELSRSAGPTGAMTRPATPLPIPHGNATPAPGSQALPATMAMGASAQIMSPLDARLHPSTLEPPAAPIADPAAASPMGAGAAWTLPPAPGPRRSRAPLWIGLASAVVAVGVVAGVLVSRAGSPAATDDRTEADPKAGVASAPAAVGATATPPPAPTPTPTPDPVAPAPTPTPAPSPGTLVVTVDVKHARIELDGAVVAEDADGARITVDEPGEHELVVTARGRKKSVRTVNVAPGATVEVAVKLERAASVRPPKPPKGGAAKDCVLDLDGRCR